MKVTGMFQITDWQESVMLDLEGSKKISQATVQQTYNGDINGTSHVKYILSYGDSGDAHFNGFEVIKGLFQDVEGEIVLKHDGCFEAGVASSRFVVVQVSEGLDLLDLKGKFKSGDAGQAHYEIVL